ncbi:MAG: DUF2087 domain-containing protein [Bacillota bacterium]
MQKEKSMEWNETLFNETVNTFFSKSNPKKLEVYPSKRKKLERVLRVVITWFEEDTLYDELSVNELLMDIHPEYIRLRRDLVDFGFLKRKTDGSAYWRKPDLDQANHY